MYGVVEVNGEDSDVVMKDDVVVKIRGVPGMEVVYKEGFDDVYREDLFEVRPAPSAGLGMYATAPIAAGTLLIRESPLLTLPEHATQPQLHILLSSLEPSARDNFYSLSAYRPRKPDTSFISALRHSYTGSYDFDDLCESMIHDWAIYETNRFTVRSANGERDQLGLFPLAARLNHSCRPNVFHRHNHLLGKLTIYALKDIYVGEQVCTSYIDIVHDTNERRRLLRHWGFKCMCTVCTGKDPIGNDVRRRRLESLMRKVRAGEDRRTDSEWSQWDYAKAQGLVEEVVGLMTEEGLDETDTLGEVLGLGTEYAMGVGWWDTARQWAERGLEVEESCLGRESAEWMRAKERLDEASQGAASNEAVQ